MCYPDKTFMRSRMCSAILMAVCAGMMAVCFADAFKANNSFCAEPSLSGKVTQSNMERISGGDVPMSDPGKRVKTVCDCMFGAGSFEKANVEKRETDSAYCFALTFPGGTNCTIRVMKKDGKVICDKAPKISEAH